jgi:hypothetical protein
VEARTPDDIRDIKNLTGIKDRLSVFRTRGSANEFHAKAFEFLAFHAD